MRNEKAPALLLAALCQVLLLTALLLYPGPLSARQDAGFDAWLKDLREEALRQGISAKTLDLALKDVRPIQEVLDLDRSQPEFKMSFSGYLDRVVTERRISDGKDKYEENAATLREVAGRYGVEPRFVVALWGIESNYGRTMGRFQVISALATLAYDGRRSAFFRKELLNALKIVDQGHIAMVRMKGSWAGAMGQVQFMPSTFATYAVDYEGDGRIDIWGSTSDALASAANYLRRSGWRTGEGWGQEVLLPGGFSRAAMGMGVQKCLREWASLGVRRPGGHPLSGPPERRASLIQPDPKGSRVFLVYDNYRSLLKWNASDYFALSVGLLADQIGMP